MSKVYYLTFGTTGDPRTFGGLAPTFLTFSNNGTSITPPAIGAVTGATGFYSFTWGTTTPICFMADAATTSPGAVGRYVVGSIDPVDRSDEYGTTMIAIGTSLIGIGTTSIGFGVTNLALGTTAVAVGRSMLAFGVSIFAQGVSVLAQGSTTLGFGFTNFGYGVSIYAGLGFQGATFSSFASLIGDQTSNIGSTGVDPSTMFGFLKRNLEISEGVRVYTKATGLLDFYNRGMSTLLRENTISDTATQTTKT